MSETLIDIPFVEFPKIARLNREIVVTEKIDGENASVCVAEDGRVLAGSRTRWLPPGDDPSGFARWVKAHEEELRVGLGYGTHFGEWWGRGLGRAYGLTEKRFSLFNVSRWTDAVRPACCHVVPTLYRGPFSEEAIKETMGLLATEGSRAAPGFMRPEGVVVFHTASQQLFKVTLDKDHSPKSLSQEK